MSGRGAASGPVAVAIAAVGIVGSMLVSPAFSLTTNALSDLGQPGNPAASPVTTLLFDGGLVLAGVLGLAFVEVLLDGHRIERLAALPFVIAMLGMVGVGLFPLGTALHTPAALTLYSGAIVAMGVAGVGTVTSDDTGRGLATIGLAVAHAGVWFWWAAAGSVMRPGLAVPELLGAGLFAVWVCWSSVQHWRDNRELSTAETGANW